MSGSDGLVGKRLKVEWFDFNQNKVWHYCQVEKTIMVKGVTYHFLKYNDKDSHWADLGTKDYEEVIIDGAAADNGKNDDKHDNDGLGHSSGGHR